MPAVTGQNSLLGGFLNARPQMNGEADRSCNGFLTLLTIIRKWGSLSEIGKSGHSRRGLPPRRLRKAFAAGYRTGVR